MNKAMILVLGMTLISCSNKDKNNNAMDKVDLATGYEKDNNTTATYSEAIAFYEMLEKVDGRRHITVQEAGPTDSGHPLHEVIITNDGVFDPIEIRKKGKAILLINNAIHPGEPCGVDASMMLARDFLVEDDLTNLLERMVVVIIPVYNISGSLNRGSFSRANQEGPAEYGFRGNGQNRDLNRDFIKCDTDNAKTFNRLFARWNPDVLVDNHTSNGADYQYVMTLIPTQKDKMEAPLASYMVETMMPELYAKMEQKGYEMIPYVYAQETPDEGIAGFLDLPRYSSGYASLHNTISYMPETHMLKPYKDRVQSTYLFLLSTIEHIYTHKEALLKARKEAQEITKAKQDFDLNWEMDQNRVDKIIFKGYEAKYKTSEISGLDRLYYDRNAPYTKEIDHYNSYKPKLTIQKPQAYIIPRAYKRVVDLMEANGVEVMRLNQDEAKSVEVYRIDDYDTSKSPYEGHYLHSNLKVSKSIETIPFLKGDYIIYTNQSLNNYIVHTLEPQAPDSWFSWNFFDGILMQKEHFSAYVFEDTGAKFLSENPEVKALLEKKKKEDSEFAKNGYAQLNFVYEHSPYYEPTYKRYPVFRLL